MEEPVPSRRQFMAAIGNLASASWIAMNWPQIAVAAEHVGHMGHEGHAMAEPPTKLSTLTAAEAAEVDAIANLIVPGGATPGARDARVIFFIDNALGSFFAAQLPAFRQGLAKFSAGYTARYGADKPFSAASALVWCPSSVNTLSRLPRSVSCGPPEPLNALTNGE